MEQQLQRDFREMEGRYIPYKSFGFNKLTDFLEESNEFVLTNLIDGIHIRAKLSKASQHMADMVQGQNRAKKKKSDRIFIPRLHSAPSTANWGPRTQTKVFKLSVFMFSSIYRVNICVLL